MKVPYRYIAIEGTIGAGKTTLAKLLAKDLNAKLILEEFEDNHFLAKFYKDPERFALPLELSFLADRFKQLQKELVHASFFHDHQVADYCFYKSIVFSKNTLPSEEFKLFRQFFSILSQQIPKPDIILYLYASADRLLEQIKKRGRPYEMNIQREYLEAIQSSYLEFFYQFSSVPILLLDMEKIDFVARPEDFEYIKSLLKVKYEKSIHRFSKL